jgi:hypothetical protein
MALEGPKVVYARKEDESALARALRLAREVEELLEIASSTALGRDALNGAHSTHSTRIVRAMAASLVDELEGMVRGARKSDVS